MKKLLIAIAIMLSLSLPAYSSNTEGSLGFVIGYGGETYTGTGTPDIGATIEVGDLQGGHFAMDYLIGMDFSTLSEANDPDYNIIDNYFLFLGGGYNFRLGKLPLTVGVSGGAVLYWELPYYKDIASYDFGLGLRASLKWNVVDSFAISIFGVPAVTFFEVVFDLNGGKGMSLAVAEPLVKFVGYGGIAFSWCWR